MCAKGQNWLITSASAKVDLVRRMRAAAHACGAKLYVADMDPLAAAFHFADGFVCLPALGSEGYDAALLGYCREHAIGVILPTRDGDVAYFADRKEHLSAQGIIVIASRAETVGICLDKVAFYEHCIQSGLPVLPRVDGFGEGDFPCFVRCRTGSGGTGARKLTSSAQFQSLYGDIPCDDLLIQPYVEMPEFTVDILFAGDGTPVQWIARERLRVMRGESCVGETVQIPALDALVLQVSKSMVFVGPVTLQCFYTSEAGPLLIEVNPRIGGGAALGIEAGLDTPSRLVQLARGQAEEYARPRPLRYGVKMFRYSADLFVG